MAVAIFTALIQSFVFVLLSCIYIAGAVAHEEEHDSNKEN
jgi:F-type H+-transporting ATPase subunit a